MSCAAELGWAGGSACLGGQSPALVSCLKVTHTAPASPMGVDIYQQINAVLSSASQDKARATYLVCSFRRDLGLHNIFLMISVLLIHRLEEMFSELPRESNTPCHSDSEILFFCCC